MDELETVYSCTFLDQVIAMDGSNAEEIDNRVKLAWRTFGRNSIIIIRSYPICLKSKVFDQSIFSVLPYVLENWTLTSETVRKLQSEAWEDAW